MKKNLTLFLIILTISVIGYSCSSSSAGIADTPENIKAAINDIEGRTLRVGS